MLRIPGIIVNKTSTGKIKSLTIDVKKHAVALAPILQEMGLSQILLDSEKAEFDKKWAKGITSEQLKSHLLTTVRSLPWSNKK
jgi:hypothetical protein